MGGSAARDQQRCRRSPDARLTDRRRWPEPSDASSLIVRSRRVILGDGVLEPLRVEPACLGITEATIEAIEPWESNPPKSAGVLDFGDKIVCPAFINAHTHVAMNAFRGLSSNAELRGNIVEDWFYRLEAELTPKDIRAFARMGAYECVEHGVGLVWDHYYGGVELAEAFTDVGLSAVVSPTLQDQEGPGASESAAALQLTCDLATRRWAKRGIFAAVGAHATDTVSAELWNRVRDSAEGRCLPVHAHLAQSVSEWQRIRKKHGCTPIELLERVGILDLPRALLVHALFLSERDFDCLNPKRHTLGYCPLSQAQFAFPAALHRWQERGLPWILATDCAASNDAMNPQRELALVSATRGFRSTEDDSYRAFRARGDGISADQLDEARRRHLGAAPEFGDASFLLSRVWSVPGGLHPEFRAGVLAVGARANLLVINAEHPCFWPATDPIRTLAFADVNQAIERVMVSGVFLPRGEALRESPQFLAHLEEAERRLSELLCRLGLRRLSRGG